MAQSQDQRCVWVSTQEAFHRLDSLSLLPGSVKIQEPTKSGLTLQYDINTNQIHLKGKSLVDSVLICYKVLPFNLSKRNYRRDGEKYDSLEKYSDQLFKFPSPPIREKEEIFELEGIQKSGNITRGVSVGNQQNAFVNSSLNLQLEGPLTEEIHLLASISDQDVPFQPEGNTLQLQDFDRVFIELSHRLGKLRVGDIVFKNQENYFLKYYKNVQGGMLEAQYPIDSTQKAATRFGFALSKGKFGSIQIPALEGVQGPYRIIGPNGERFIIVLANSEKVFLDGQLLTRGFNNDYVIDYNLAEITFNPGVLITQFSRIRVDFEYSEQSYTRSILSASHYHEYKQWEAFLNLYQAADNPRNPVLSLSDQDIEQLSEVGDALGFINGVDSVGFRNNEILYALKDSISANTGIFYPDILVYSTQSQEALYRVSFTQTGPQTGNYIRQEQTLNGPVYQWVEPINGLAQGDYRAQRVVPTPSKQQVITAGLAYRLSDREKVFGEIAFSELDRNRYSTVNNEDNRGQAFKVGYANLGKAFQKNSDLSWSAEIDYEYNSPNFRPIDRFRSIEYNRDWSIQSDTSRASEQIINASLGLEKDVLNQAKYRFSYRERAGEAEGWQQALNLRKELGPLLFQYDMFLLRNQLDSLRSEWQRIQADLAYRFSFGSWGYRYEQDKNQVLLPRADSVLRSAMFFDQHQVYFRSPDSTQWQLEADFSLRYDQRPVEGLIQKQLSSQTANVRYRHRFSPQQQLAITLSYRRLENQSAAQAAQDENNIMGRLDWKASFWERHFRSELSFATLTGRELRREFIFLAVATGEGTHTWRDENEDGIQDLNEFYLAINPDEREFIKVFTPTDEYIEAFINNFSYRANWQAPRNWAKEKGFKNFLSRFSQVLSWTINKRFTEDSFLSRILPFRNLNEEFVLSTREALRSTLFFNRSKPAFGLEAKLFQNRQKQLLSNGFEDRKQSEYALLIRKNLGTQFTLIQEGSWEETRNESNVLLDRNYEIRTYRIEPQLAFQPKPEIRLTGSYRFSLKNSLGLESMGENAQQHEFKLELRWNKVGKRNLLASLRYVNILFEGEVNSPIGYELLEALNPGTNWTWSLNWQQRLSNGLQLIFTYDGRKPPEQNTIHVGRVQVTAFF